MHQINIYDNRAANILHVLLAFRIILDLYYLDNEKVVHELHPSFDLFSHEIGLDAFYYFAYDNLFNYSLVSASSVISR